ncbi:uncharacterized protein NPIL_4911, partial [Nephila pilipes]
MHKATEGNQELSICDRVYQCTDCWRRQVAKLALNSFWGRWGMNLNKTKLSYVSSVPDFNRYLSDPTKKIKDIFLPSEE